MKRELLGWFRPVLLAKADSKQRLRPSDPRVNSSSRNCESEFLGRNAIRATGGTQTKARQRAAEQAQSLGIYDRSFW